MLNPPFLSPSDQISAVVFHRKAFDLIDYSLLINSINPCIINWIRDFLMDRKQRVKMANDIQSGWKDVVAGVPQGTKLGPQLFLVMIT